MAVYCKGEHQMMHCSFYAVLRTGNNLYIFIDICYTYIYIHTLKFNRELEFATTLACGERPHGKARSSMQATLTTLTCLSTLALHKLVDACACK